MQRRDFNKSGQFFSRKHYQEDEAGVRKAWFDEIKLRMQFLDSGKVSIIAWDEVKEQFYRNTST